MAVTTPRVLGAALAAATSLSAGGLDSLLGKVEQITLENGMKFLLVPQGDAPVFAGLIRFNVGGVDEVPGITGLAHLFEHMAFKGTRTIGTSNYAGEKVVLDGIDRIARELAAEEALWEKSDPTRVKMLRTQLEAVQKLHKDFVVKDEFTLYYTQSGAKGLNATTSKDFTTYFVNLPANRLELWMLLESERLANPVLREFYSERDVVQEERRMRVDDNPGGKLYEQFTAAAFTAHPYRFPTVGWSSDIATVTKEEGEAFYQAYYSPRNAVGALVGRFDVAEAKRMVQRYFGRLVNRGEIQRPRTKEPQQVGVRRVRVEKVAEPDMMVGWHKPTLPHPDAYAFEVLDAVLTSGRTSRLYKRLVESRKAQGVWSYNVPGERYPNVFVISATPMPGHDNAEMEAEIQAELELLRKDLLPQRVLDKALNQIEASYLKYLAGNMGMAQELTRYHLLTGDWRKLGRHTEELRAVTPERLREVVRKYLDPDARTIAFLERKAEEGGQ